MLLVDNRYSIGTPGFNAEVVFVTGTTFVLARDDTEPARFTLSIATTINY